MDFTEAAAAQTDVSEHEFAYMPSNWSKRYGPMEILARYLKFCQDTTDEARQTIKNERDVPYSTTERTKYDVYGTDLPADAPILLFIHGGYWLEFSKDLSGFIAPNFVASGIKVIVGGYDLCPNVTLTEIIKEGKLMVEKVLKYANDLGSKAVWICGHSAGAHLAASLLHDPDWLDAITQSGLRRLLKGLILVSGIYALEPLLRTSVNEGVKLTAEEIKTYTFAPFETSADATTKASDEKDDSRVVRGVKVIVVVGECDSPVFVEESRRYARRLAKIVDNVEFLLLRDDCDHFDIVENLTKKDFILSKLLTCNIKFSS